MQIVDILRPYLATIHLFCSVVLFAVAVYILISRFKIYIARVTFFIVLGFSLWSFTNFLVVFVTSQEQAAVILKIGFVGWMFLPATLVWFAIAFVKNKTVLRSAYFPLLLFIIPLFLLFVAVFHNYFPIEKTKFGWEQFWPEHIISYIYYD